MPRITSASRMGPPRRKSGPSRPLTRWPTLPRSKSSSKGPAIVTSLSETPIALKRLADFVECSIGHEELRARGFDEHDGVLAKNPPERNSLVAGNAVDEPGWLAPGSFRLLIVADALFHPIRPENEQVAQHLVARLVHSPREQHAARVVRGYDREVLTKQRR